MGNALTPKVEKRAAKPRAAQYVCPVPLGTGSLSVVEGLRRALGHGPERGPSASPGRRHTPYPALAGLPIAAAAEPDLDAFLEGLEVAVMSGGVLLIAVVVVLTIRRFTNF